MAVRTFWVFMSHRTVWLLQVVDQKCSYFLLQHFYPLQFYLQLVIYLASRQQPLSQLMEYWIDFTFRFLLLQFLIFCCYQLFSSSLFQLAQLLWWMVKELTVVSSLQACSSLNNHLAYLRYVENSFSDDGHSFLGSISSQNCSQSYSFDLVHFY